MFSLKIQIVVRVLVVPVVSAVRLVINLALSVTLTLDLTLDLDLASNLGVFVKWQNKVIFSFLLSGFGCSSLYPGIVYTDKKGDKID